MEYLHTSILIWIAHVKKHQVKRGFCSHQFWDELNVALKADCIIGCCPLVVPSSFMYSWWDGVSTDWGYQLQSSRPIFNILLSSPEEQHFLSK
jgi:hypothetical protein